MIAKQSPTVYMQSLFFQRLIGRAVTGLMRYNEILKEFAF